MNRLNWIIAAIATSAAGGCGHGPRMVADPDPADKIPAIRTAVHDGDRKSIPHLVDDLDSDDSAVRFYAIEALRSLTGQDLAYRYYNDTDERRPAVARWKEWLASQPICKP